MTRRRAFLATTLAVPAAALALPAAAQSLLERLAGTGVGATTFVQMAASSDAFEIESSRFLLTRSQHPQIRQFAQTMIEHHTMTSNELRALPEATTRLTSSGPDERHTNKLIRLRQQETEDFVNRVYVEQQIENHEEAVTLFETYANGGDVPPLRAFAQRHLPMIRQHLVMARALQAPRQG